MSGGPCRRPVARHARSHRAVPDLARSARSRLTLGGVADLIQRRPLASPGGDYYWRSGLQLGDRRSEIGGRRSDVGLRLPTSDLLTPGLRVSSSPATAVHRRLRIRASSRRWRQIAARLGRNHVLPAFFALLRPNIQDQVRSNWPLCGVDRIVNLLTPFQGSMSAWTFRILAQCRQRSPRPGSFLTAADAL